MSGILLGYGVTLYTPTKASYRPDFRSQLVFTDKPVRLVGCLECADDKSHIAGYWMMRPGRGFYVQRIPTAFATQKGTIEVSYYNEFSSQARHTGRRIVSPMPLTGNNLSWQIFIEHKGSTIKQQLDQLKMIPVK